MTSITLPAVALPNPESTAGVSVMSARTHDTRTHTNTHTPEHCTAIRNCTESDKKDATRILNDIFSGQKIRVNRFTVLNKFR
jgi:hypothetical protein